MTLLGLALLLGTAIVSYAVGRRHEALWWAAESEASDARWVAMLEKQRAVYASVIDEARSFYLRGRQ